MKNYFEEFYKRYEELKSDLELRDIKDLKPEAIKLILNNESKVSSDSKNAQTLNNLVMAGLGMGTLYLRMGAVLMIAEKTKPENEKDVAFLKIIAEKLIHKLPADGEWKDIWNAYISNNIQGEWSQILENSQEKKAHELFVSFRNKIVHQDIIVQSDLPDQKVDEILKGLKILDAMSLFQVRFEYSIISLENNEVYFQYESNKEKLKISPYVQINKSNEPEELGILPYLFQGRYYKGAKFINTEGAETEEEKDDSLDETFDAIKSEIARFNGDKAFDFKDKINNYNEWCIGRENEVNAILEWIDKSNTDKNVLPIFAPAGLGKGALVAEVIKKLQETKVEHLFHFCSSGAANNLQAILYHLIIQGKNYDYLDKKNNKQKKNIWNNLKLSQKLQERFERLPTQYVDVIELFQALLSHTDPELNEIEKINEEESTFLVIIIDGLDEAAVADHSKRISDWFYTYDEKGERKDKWESPEHIKWVFTYRQKSKENKEGFQFEYHEFDTLDLLEVQPLKGLTEDAVMKEFTEFSDFKPALTQEYIKKIIEKGAVK
jgi:hypothetical protein